MSDSAAATRIPYCRQTLGEKEITAVVEVLKSGWIARGPKAEEFEVACAKRIGASHAISCTNGSAALEIALRSLGIGPGDEVIVPTLTWVATAMAVRMVGADPVFADIDALTHNVTPETVLACWTDRTRAVIGVDFAGIPHDAYTRRVIAEQCGAFVFQSLETDAAAKRQGFLGRVEDLHQVADDAARGQRADRGDPRGRSRPDQGAGRRRRAA